VHGLIKDRSTEQRLEQHHERSKTMSIDTMTLFAARYENKDAAISDYHAVEKLYKELKLMDTYDAAVITRTDNGKVKILEKHEQITRHGAAKGLAVGLATGVAAALFPAVALGAGLLFGGAAGAGIGAIAGHVVGGLSRSDLKTAGELLDEGESGLIVVAATDVSARIDKAIGKAEKTVKAQLDADLDELDRELRA
jgi:uncharacterized membrane protein